MRYNKLITFAAISAALFTISFFTACNGRPGDIIPDFGKYDGIYPGNIEITAAHHFASGSVSAFEKLASDFNKNNEFGIKIKLRRVEDPSEYSEYANYDLVFCSPAESSRLLRDGTSVELSPLLSHPGWGIRGERRIFYRAARNQTDYWDFSRKVTSIPLLMNASVLIFNKDSLAAAGYNKIPWNWKMMHLMLHRISRQTGLPSFGMDLEADSVAALINARGGSIQSPAGITYSFINPVVARTLRFLKQLEKRGILSANITKYANQTAFAFGNLPLVFTTTEGLKYYNDLISMVSPEMQWETGLLPTRRPGKCVTIDCSQTASIINGPLEKQLASWLFIRWLTETPQQKQLAGMTYSLPSVKQAVEEIAAQRPPEFIPQWINAAVSIDESHMEYIPDLPDYTEVGRRFQSLIKKSVFEKGWIWLGTVKLEYNTRKAGR